MSIQNELFESVTEIRKQAGLMARIAQQDPYRGPAGFMRRALRPFETPIDALLSGGWSDTLPERTVTPYQQVCPGVRLAYSRNAQQPVEMYEQHVGHIRRIYSRDAIACLRVRQDEARTWLALEIEDDVTSVIQAGRLKVMVCGKASRPCRVSVGLYFNHRERNNIEIDGGGGILSEHNNRFLCEIPAEPALLAQQDKLTCAKLVIRLKEDANYEFKLFDLRVFGMR